MSKVVEPICEECGKHPAKWLVVVRAWSHKMCGVCAGPWRRDANRGNSDWQQYHSPTVFVTELSEGTTK